MAATVVCISTVEHCLQTNSAQISITGQPQTGILINYRPARDQAEILVIDYRSRKANVAYYIRVNTHLL